MMKFKKTALSTAVLVTLGLGGMAVGPVASAAVLPNGSYVATINVTPLKYGTSGGVITSTSAKAGSDTAWNSTFSFGHLPNALSEYMTDNGTDIACDSGSTCGSSVAGDGAAGSWNMTVSDGTFTTSNFQVDAIFVTAGGTFVEYGTVNGGTIDQSTGAMTLDTTGRLGAVSFHSLDTNGGLYNQPWNIPDSSTGVLGTTYAPLITGTSSNSALATSKDLTGSVTGHPIVSNSDGTYNVILASTANVGIDWGSFDGNPYVETWNVNLAPVPIPAAAWLFGSGLIGLVGIARRKKSS